jgi:ribosomal protein S14
VSCCLRPPRQRVIAVPSAAEIIRGQMEAMNKALRSRDAEIRRRVEAGETQAAIAREFEISRERVRQIVSTPGGTRATRAAKATAYDALVAEGKAPSLDDNGDGVG